ncbi:MAG: hypothetical protein PVI12_01345, partial [Gammaproteobacteria bacterium]
IERLVGEELGIHCQVQLVPAHFLPRTSSGKLSRSKARQNYIDQLPNAPDTDVPELERAAG